MTTYIHPVEAGLCSSARTIVGFQMLPWYLVGLGDSAVVVVVAAAAAVVVAEIQIDQRRC